MMYGAEVELTDPEPFMASVLAGEKKVAIGNDAQGNRVILLGVPSTHAPQLVIGHEGQQEPLGVGQLVAVHLPGFAVDPDLVGVALPLGHGVGQGLDVDHARKEAIRANKAKSEFLSNMSHDIRTPMNAIVGMTAIATANIDDKQQVQNSLKKISLSSRHLLGLINDVLDMSKSGPACCSTPAGPRR